MEFEFNDLFKKKAYEKKIHETLTIDPFLYGGDEIKILSPVEVEGKASIHGDIIKLDILVSTIIEITCSRCLDRYPLDISLSVSEEYTNNLEQESEDVIFIADNSIDLEQVVKDNILLSLPIKRLCSEDCKGLCQSCGVNMNKTQCNCMQQDVDIRMAGLKDLFLRD